MKNIVGFSSAFRSVSQDSVYGEGWFYDNETTLTVETINVIVAMHGTTGGQTKEMTFDSGSAGATSAFADGSDGKVLVTSNGHGLKDGDIITIMGSTNYNGAFIISSTTTNTFKITDTWVANDGIATWIEPSTLTVLKAGTYHLDAHISTRSNANCTLTWYPVIDVAPVVKGTVERKFPNNDIDNNSFAIFIDLAVGEQVWMAVESDTLGDMVSRHGGMRVLKMSD